MKWQNILQLIGVGLFIYLLTTIDLNELLKLSRTVSLASLLFVIILFVPQILTKVIRWKIIMKALSINYPLKKAALAYASSIFVGTITIGKLGEFIKVFYLKEEGNSYSKSFISVILDRLADVTFLFILGSIALYASLKDIIGLYLLLIIVVGLLTVLFFIYIKPELTRTALQRIIPKKIYPHILETINQLKKINLQTIFLIGFLTISTWLIFYLQVYIIVQNVSIPINYFQLGLFLSIAGIITMIPISISGLGTRDVTLIFLYGLIGLSSAQAILTSFSVLLIYLLAGSIGAICWFIQPINIKKIRRTIKK